jgi:hypothetical protein
VSESEQVPWLGVAETSVSPAGSGSFTVTPVALQARCCGL